MATCSFTKNQHVIYASNGICTVEDVKMMSFVSGAPEKLYYVLRPKNDAGSTIYIPDDNALLVSRIRVPLIRDEINGLIQALKDSAEAWIDDRKLRIARYNELLSAPHPAQLLPLIRVILERGDELLKSGKRLSNADRDVLSSALRLVRDELSLCFDTAEEMNEFIEGHTGARPELI